MAVSPDVRYSVSLIASTLGSSAAASRKCSIDAVNESNGWWTSRSRSRITANIDLCGSRSSAGTDARERRVPQVGDVERGDRHEVAEVEQRPGVLHVVLGERGEFGGLLVAQFLEQQRPQMRRHRVLHFEPHDFAEPPLEHLLLDHLQQVFGFVGGREVEVRVARHPERVPPHDLHPREQRAEIGADQLLERHELVGAPERAPTAGGSSGL